LEARAVDEVESARRATRGTERRTAERTANMVGNGVR
jgi:hypothetical protein